MLLDIIVPHYDEPWSVGKKLFDMLSLQRGIDFSSFRILLVNDGENSVYPEVAKQKYPFEVVGLSIPHSGVSAARNRGLEYSNAKWVMFCDFDDTFSSIYSMRSIMDVLFTEDHDLLWCPFYIEICPEQRCQIRSAFNYIFIHGKIFRRSFLIKHGIRFEESLYFSEDTAFNRVVEMEIEQGRIGEIKTDIVPYVWTYRPGSATTDPQKMFSNSVGLFRRQCYVAEQHMIRGMKEDHDALVMRAMCDAYVALNRTDINGDRDRFAKEVWDFYKDRQGISVSVDIISIALAGSMNEMNVKQEQLPKDKPFMQWLSDFVRKHEKGETHDKARN